MRETLTQPCREDENGRKQYRVVKFCQRSAILRSPPKLVPANLVPAAAVIREERVLYSPTGRTASYRGIQELGSASDLEAVEGAENLFPLCFDEVARTSRIALECVDPRRTTDGEVKPPVSTDTYGRKHEDRWGLETPVVHALTNEKASLPI